MADLPYKFTKLNVIETAAVVGNLAFKKLNPSTQDLVLMSVNDEILYTSTDEILCI